MLSRPRLLEIEGHPIREIGHAIQNALSEYELISGEEVVKKTSYGVGSGLTDAYEVDEETVLRPETSVTTFSAISGRVPPVRITTAGRVFRDSPEDATHLRAFHQFEALCIEAGADDGAMRATVEKAIRAYLPVEQVEDPNNFMERIDEYTFEEWLNVLVDRYIQKLYDRGVDKLAVEAGRKIDIFK